MTNAKKLILAAAALVLLFLAATFVVSGMQGRSAEAEARLDAHAPQQSR
jgi:hypothetical protein